MFPPPNPHSGNAGNPFEELRPASYATKRDGIRHLSGGEVSRG